MAPPQDDRPAEDEPARTRTPSDALSSDAGSGDLHPGRSRRLEGSPRRGVLRARVPVWLLLASLLLVTGFLGFLLLDQASSAVDLGPAVGAAESVEVQMTLCNADVDELDLNPRDTELDLEKVLREEGARNANVVVDRKECPKPQP